MRGVLTCIALVASVLAFSAEAQAATLQGYEKAAFAKLKHAQRSGAIDGATAASARAEVARAAHLVRSLPNGRGYHVQVALAEAAMFPAAYTKPRVLQLYGGLRENDDFFAKHWAPADKTDLTGADGVVYRYFAGYCFRFHPLADFGVLNADVASGNVAATEALADALVERGVYQKGGGIAWEYDFPFGGGRAPWLSGMAQAVGAQAFAGAASLVTTKTSAYMTEATAAYRLIPKRLVTSVAAGPWIKQYSFQTVPILNADLQAVISLRSYATAANDASALALANRMQTAAAQTLPKFDTGYWSYYELPREPSTVGYHDYVVSLLKRLAKTDPRFASAATRFAAYEKQPPAFQLQNAGVGEVRFWLSKPSSVRVDTNAGPSRTYPMLDGWHTLSYKPRRSGVYPVHISATDWLGNKAQFDALPIVYVGGKPAQAAPVALGSTTTPEPAAPFVIAQRATLTWPDGATAPDPTTIASLAGKTLVELDYATTATSASSQYAAGSFTQYAASLAQQVPGLGYLVLGPPPSTATAADYAQSLASVSTAVHAVLPNVAVGPLVDGAATPKPTLAAAHKAGLGGDVIVFRAAPTTAGGSWTQPNLTLLKADFGGTVPPILLDQPSDAAVTAAACSTTLAGIVLAAPPGAAVNALQRGTIVCPGSATQAETTALTFPTSLQSGVGASFQVGCLRDCVYVATLVGANRRAIVATRGSLQGGATPATVTLPKTSLGQASYTIDVRIENRVDPGPSLALASDAIPVGATTTP